MGNFGVPLAASLSYSICNGFFELQACEKRKKSLLDLVVLILSSIAGGAAGVCAIRSTELTVFTMIPRGMINAFGLQFWVVAVGFSRYVVYVGIGLERFGRFWKVMWGLDGQFWLLRTRASGQSAPEFQKKYRKCIKFGSWRSVLVATYSG